MGSGMLLFRRLQLVQDYSIRPYTCQNNHKLLEQNFDHEILAIESVFSRCRWPVRSLSRRQSLANWGAFRTWSKYRAISARIV